MLKAQKNITTGVIPFHECRAKTCKDGSPGTFVFDHCRYAGAIAEALHDLLPKSVKCKFPPHPELLVALHDIGKVSPGFQGKYFFPLLEKFSPSWAKTYQNMGTNTNHAEVGAESLRIFFETQDKMPAVQAIAAHHGYRPQNISMLNDQKDWQPEREKLIHSLGQEFAHQLSREEIEIGRADLLTGLTCVADWIASDEKFFSPKEAPLDAETLAQRVKSVLQECGFYKTKVRSGLSFYDIFGFNPREEQAALIRTADCPGVYILEAAMGSGKTEAALYAAYQMMASGINNGLYFALPTRLTSDKIHERVETFIAKILDVQKAVKLAHGQAWLKEFEHGSQEDGKAHTPIWFSPAKRGLLYPFSVGTIDQALLSVMNVKHSFVRLFGLAGKVVILDEVHSYDLYTGTLLDTLVQALRNIGCTVIILSATLTKMRRKKLLGTEEISENGYPLVTGMPVQTQKIISALPQSNKSDMSVDLKWLYADATAVIADALKQARTGCNVVCIANTVKKSQLWYRTLLTEMCDDDCQNLKYGLLHSRFPFFRREAIENYWIKALGKGDKDRPAGSVLIATQIVEQSIDIDADYMISELAPVDMLLQRMGRLWRHERQNRPCDSPLLTLVLERDPLQCQPLNEISLKTCIGTGSWYVYAPFVLLRSYEEMIKRKFIVLPSDIRLLLESVYDDSQIQNSTGLHKELLKKMKEKQEKLQSRALSAGVNVSSMPILSDDDENPPTRYNSQKTVSLLIVRDMDAAASRNQVSMTLLNGDTVQISQYEKNISVTRALYQNLVSIPISDFFNQQKKDIMILQQHFFASEMPYVCVLGKDGKSLFLNDTGEALGYAYRDDFGVYANLEPDGTANTSASNSEADLLPLEKDFMFKEGEDW
ncbi:MAG: CRISPR-associated helicase Cas3' [Lentisphaeria bacterium]